MQEQPLKKVAMVGRPNVDKSSLLNRLARQRDAELKKLEVIDVKAIKG